MPRSSFSLLYGRGVGSELFDAALAFLITGSVVWLIAGRKIRRDMASMPHLPPGARKEPLHRIRRRALLDGLWLGLLMAFAVDVYEGETGTLAGLVLGAAAVLELVRREILRWQARTGGVAYRQRGWRLSGKVFQAPADECEA